VSVRTLHLYDRLGLLKPAKRTRLGYRLYGPHELEQIEHILALRRSGFALKRIANTLRVAEQPLIVRLQFQRQMLRRRQEKYQHALLALCDAEQKVSGGGPVDRWELLTNIIKALRS
jgi:DNA-binding transcriptional MerR regulator